MSGSGPRFARYPWWRRWFGNRSERAAARFLRRLGYRVVARNVFTSAGEIDLIALDRDTIVIAEVRSTESGDRERTALSIGPVKQRKITESALAFLAPRNLLDVSIRFDVLIVDWAPGADEPVVEHFPHAFEATGRYQMFS